MAHACKCESCTAGCRHGSGAFADGEIEKLAEFMNLDPEVLKKEFLEEIEKFNTKRYRPRIKRKDRPYGKCIFFDEDIGCKIHEAKPLECKVAMGCKDYGEDLILWFVLNHFVNKDDPESVRQLASYLKAGGKTLDGGKPEDMIDDKEKLRRILDSKTKIMEE